MHKRWRCVLKNHHNKDITYFVADRRAHTESSKGGTTKGLSGKSAPSIPHFRHWPSAIEG